MRPTLAVLLASLTAMAMASAHGDVFAPLAERYVRLVRSYVINYNLGKDLVRAHVERLGGTADRPVDRWRLFGELLASPRLPSGL